MGKCWNIGQKILKSNERIYSKKIIKMTIANFWTFGQQIKQNGIIVSRGPGSGSKIFWHFYYSEDKKSKYLGTYSDKYHESIFIVYIDTTFSDGEVLCYYEK